MRKIWITVCAFALTGCGSTHSQTSSALDQTEGGLVNESQLQYEYRTPNRDGIGKFYLGREISHVMGHLGAEWLERPSRQREERTDLLIRNLPLEKDSVVADIGAGTGYFSFRMAKRVPQGRVLAVDIQPEMLAIIEQQKSEQNLSNVETILGTVSDPRLPESEVDLILLVDAYHEFSFPREMGMAMRRSLKPGGKLILIEYRGEDSSVPIKPLHKMDQRQARREMKAAGLDWVDTRNFLPQQHFMIFQRPLQRTETPSEGPTASAVR